MVTGAKKAKAGKSRVEVGKLGRDEGKVKELSAAQQKAVKGGSLTDLIIDPFTALQPKVKR